MTDQRPLVSVIIPVFNNAGTVSDAIRSVLDQSYSRVEVIAIDDGSSDDSLDQLRKFVDRVTILTQTNAGAAAARNSGMHAAQGEYIAFLDADDLWLPDKLAKQVEMLETTHEVDLVCGLWRCWYPSIDDEDVLENYLSNSEICGNSTLNLEGWIYHYLLLDCYVWTSTVVMRRSLVGQIGEFDAAMRRGQDYDYWLRASRETKIIRLPQPLALYRMREEPFRPPNGKMVDYESLIVDRAVERWGLASPDGSSISLSAYRQRRIELALGFANTASRAGTWSDAALSTCRALTFNPISVAVWYRVARSLAGIVRRSGERRRRGITDSQGSI